MAFDEGEDLGLPAGLHLHRQLYVGAIKTEHNGRGIAGEELCRDVLAGDLVGGRREGSNGNAGEYLAQTRKILVFRAERRPPLGNAMSLVDRDQADVEPA